MTIDVRPLEANHQDAAFDLATRVFVQGSTLHQALGIGLTQYRSYLAASFARMVGEGLSYCAVDGRTGELVGCLIVTDFHGQSGTTGPSDPPFAPIEALTAELAGRYRKHRRIGPGEAVLVDMGAVSTAAGGQGIYQRLRRAAQERARDIGYRWVLGELSSAATQHFVLDRLRHRKLTEVFFDSFQHDNGFPFRDITDPPSVILAEGEL